MKKRFGVLYALFVFLLLAASGCSGRAEGLVVSMQTDFVPALEFDAVRARVDEDDPREIGVSS